jgi:hypothetical protein
MAKMAAQAMGATGEERRPCQRIRGGTHCAVNLLKPGAAMILRQAEA